jgi:hypothetical protein
MRLGGYVRQKKRATAQSIRHKVYIVLAIIAAHFGALQLFAMFSEAPEIEMIEHVDYYDITDLDEEGNPVLPDELFDEDQAPPSGDTGTEAPAADPVASSETGPATS